MAGALVEVGSPREVWLRSGSALLVGKGCSPEPTGLDRVRGGGGVTP